MRLKLSLFIISTVALINFNTGFAFTMFLNNGYFYGPGNAVYNDTNIHGQNQFTDGQVRNIFFSSPNSGGVSFYNNGAAEPNVIAEKLQVGGVVDGLASDGTPINENADTALRLNFRRSDSSESADVMAVAIASPESPDGSEPIEFDEKGNLTFSPSILADPGEPELISRFNVKFTTGAAQVPLSLNTQEGLSGGEDNAGPLPAGRFLVGRMGDYDQDGYMDGVLVLAENSPLDLIVARGNPIAQYRPWTSDIPVAAVQAAVLTLNGIAQNYPVPVMHTIYKSEYLVLLQSLSEIDSGLDAALINLRREILAADAADPGTVILKEIREQVLAVQRTFAGHYQFIENLLVNGDEDVSIYKSILEKRLQRSFTQLGAVLSSFAPGNSVKQTISQFNSLQ